MTADNEIEIKEAFQRAQKGHNNKAKLVASLKSRYMKVRAAGESQLHRVHSSVHHLTSMSKKDSQSSEDFCRENV